MCVFVCMNREYPRGQMITLKYSKLRDPNFQQALYKLTNYTGFPTKTCITIAKLKKCIDSESVIAQDAFIALLKQYAELDEKGNFVPEDNKKGTFKIIEAKVDEWQKAVEEFSNKLLSVEKFRIDFEDVKDAKLSPQDFIALEDIFKEVDESALA